MNNDQVNAQELSSEEISTMLKALLKDTKESFEQFKKDSNGDIDQLEKGVTEYIEQTSDRLADIYDPNRIQYRIMEETSKKLESRKLDWVKFDYGLRDLQIMTSLIGDTSGQSLESLPSSILLEHPMEHPTEIDQKQETQQQEKPIKQTQDSMKETDQEEAVPITPTQKMPSKRATTQSSEPFLSPEELLKTAQTARERLNNKSKP